MYCGIFGLQIEELKESGNKALKIVKDEMLSYPQLLLIGGTGRNVGKTEFTCRLISRIAATRQIYALKVSAMYPDEQMFHGRHEYDASDFHLFEESRSESGKDTARMLKAGAKRVFYLQGEDNRILQGFTEFIHKVPTSSPVVCESNSLGNFVQPGLHIMITSSNTEVKERARVQLAKADLIIKSDGASGFQDLEALHFSEAEGWYLVY